MVLQEYYEKLQVAPGVLLFAEIFIKDSNIRSIHLVEYLFISSAKKYLKYSNAF